MTATSWNDHKPAPEPEPITAPSNNAENNPKRQPLSAVSANSTPSNTALREQIEKIVHAIRNDGWNNGFNTDDKPWVDQILKIIQANQTEAVVAELKQCRKYSADPTLKKFIGWRIQKLTAPNQVEEGEWDTKPLSPEEVLKVQEETDREIRSE